MPVAGVITSAVIAVILTLPALVTVKIPVDGQLVPTPVAFFAVVSIGVVGLYLAFAIPIFLRWRAGDAFRVGRWTLGRKYRWMAPLAVAEIVVTSIVAMFPTSTGGAPWYDGFAWKFVNYTPLVVFGLIVILELAWQLSVKNWFTGPKTTLETPPAVDTTKL